MNRRIVSIKLQSVYNSKRLYNNSYKSKSLSAPAKQPFFSGNASFVQRKPDAAFFHPASQLQRKGVGCGKEEKKIIQQKADSATIESPSPDNSINHSGGGKPLPGKILSGMNAAFGTDFSQVSIHTGNEAIQMNKELHARAFTVGKDIYFNIGKYDPETSEGKHLLAHELTHVMQQEKGKKMANRKEEERYCPNADVNDATVQSHIDSALASAKNNLQIAFSILRNKRENNCCDVNLAAAEHYMYARWQVAQGDWSFFWITMIIMYDFAKFLHLVPKTGDCPITRASWAQIKWASQGAVDGEMDYYNNPH